MIEFNRRKYLQKLISHKHNRLVKIVTGVRRCGKSYLLFNLFKQHLLDSGVEASHIIEIVFDDRRRRNLRNPDACIEYVLLNDIDERNKKSQARYASQAPECAE